MVHGCAQSPGLHPALRGFFLAYCLFLLLSTTTELCAGVPDLWLPNLNLAMTTLLRWSSKPSPDACSACWWRRCTFSFFREPGTSVYCLTLSAWYSLQGPSRIQPQKLEAKRTRAAGPEGRQFLRSSIGNQSSLCLRGENERPKETATQLPGQPRLASA